MLMRFFPFLKNIHTFVMDVLFPVRCLGCGKYDTWICKECLAKIIIQPQQVCPICEKRTTPCGETCFGCLDKKRLDGLLAVSSYQNELMRNAVHYCKYRFIPDLHEPLGELMLGALQSFAIPLPELIIPVPLHPRRMRWRGFNQAELLAQYLGNNLAPALPLEISVGNLTRKKYTTPQMNLGEYLNRKENVINAFEVTNPELLKNKTILLVDDIATTGSTLFECARILKKAGAKKVTAIVLARQSPKQKL